MNDPGREGEKRGMYSYFYPGERGEEKSLPFLRRRKKRSQKRHPVYRGPEKDPGDPTAKKGRTRTLLRKNLKKRRPHHHPGRAGKRKVAASMAGKGRKVFHIHSREKKQSPHEEAEERRPSSRGGSSRGGVIGDLPSDSVHRGGGREKTGGPAEAENNLQRCFRGSPREPEEGRGGFRFGTEGGKKNG